jgi:tRNA 2-thiouridine synthesizing protein E
MALPKEHDMVLVQQARRNHPKVITSTLSLYVDGRLVQLDSKGYLINPTDWSVALTEQMAEEDNLILTDDHWLLIAFLRRFHREYHKVPNLPLIARHLCRDGTRCRWNRKYIQKLFPGGAMTACRYAGLPASVRDKNTS